MPLNHKQLQPFRDALVACYPGKQLQYAVARGFGDKWWSKIDVSSADENALQLVQLFGKEGLHFQLLSFLADEYPHRTEVRKLVATLAGVELPALTPVLVTLLPRLLPIEEAEYAADIPRRASEWLPAGTVPAKGESLARLAVLIAAHPAAPPVHPPHAKLIGFATAVRLEAGDAGEPLREWADRQWAVRPPVWSMPRLAAAAIALGLAFGWGVAEVRRSGLRQEVAKTAAVLRPVAGTTDEQKSGVAELAEAVRDQFTTLRQDVKTAEAALRPVSSEVAGQQTGVGALAESVKRDFLSLKNTANQTLDNNKELNGQLAKLREPAKVVDLLKLADVLQSRPKERPADSAVPHLGDRVLFSGWVTVDDFRTQKNPPRFLAGMAKDAEQGVMVVLQTPDKTTRPRGVRVWVVGTVAEHPYFMPWVVSNAVYLE